MIAHTTQLNRVGIALAGLDGVHAMTDVTGFGLLGHLLEMMTGAKAKALLALERLWPRRLLALERLWPQRPRWPRPLSIALTFLLVTLAWVLFRAPTLDGALRFYASLGSGGLALPAGWQAVAVRRNIDVAERYQATAANDLRPSGRPAS